jgi:hypothetical protein
MHQHYKKLDNWKSQWYYKRLIEKRSDRQIQNIAHFQIDRSREVTDKEYSKLHNVIIYSSRILLI